ncbi:hypothetical protein [Joostella sp.]|uniref:hypothetical protein n=1 Tax=Joostella sp. TaxID=2231138 RepID=UPI003A9001F0
MKQKLIPFLSVLIPLTIILAVAQYFIQANIFPETTFFYSTWIIYTFHFVITLIIYISILAVHNVLPDKTGLAFLAFTGLKMFAAIVFLIPLFQNDMANPIPTVFSFFIPYFIYLFLEAFYVIKLLK